MQAIFQNNVFENNSEDYEDEDSDQVFKPSECYFAFDQLDGELIVAITDIKTWEKEGCLNDCFGDHSLPEDILPNYMGNLMEAMWSADNVPLSQVREDLLKIGFKESFELQEFMDSFNS